MDKAHDDFMDATHNYCRQADLPLPADAAVIGSGIQDGGVMSFLEKHPWATGAGLALLGLATGGIADIGAAGLEGVMGATVAETAAGAAETGASVEGGVDSSESAETAASKAKPKEPPKTKWEKVKGTRAYKMGVGGASLGTVMGIQGEVSAAGTSDATAAQRSAMAQANIAAQNQAAQSASQAQEAGDAMQS